MQQETLFEDWTLTKGNWADLVEEDELANPPAASELLSFQLVQTFSQRKTVVSGNHPQKKPVAARRRPTKNCPRKEPKGVMSVEEARGLQAKLDVANLCGALLCPEAKNIQMKGYRFVCVISPQEPNPPQLVGLTDIKKITVRNKWSDVVVFSRAVSLHGIQKETPWIRPESDAPSPAPQNN